MINESDTVPRFKEVDVALAVYGLLHAVGQDVDRQGLVDTPKRVMKFWREFLSPAPFELTVFDNDGSDEMIVQTNIPMYSLCEHHLLPFFGEATVAYLPTSKIIGLSKLARVVDAVARAPQNQERITRMVADQIEHAVSPAGVAVVVTARHLCMEMRGIKARGACTTTSDMRGVFRNDSRARAELLALAKREV